MDSRDRRGQLILVAGFCLAVAFVVLALVLNTAVYTENLATRNHDRTDDALAFEGAVEQGVGGLVSAVNERDADHAALRAALDANVSTWSANASFLGAARGGLRSASLAGVENGTRLANATPGEFANGTLAAPVNETRRFRLVATPESTDGVTVTVANDSESWTVTVSANSSDASRTDVVAAGGGETRTHTTNASTVEVDVTAGVVNGTRVENWTFAEGVTGPYTTSISNDGATTGTYALVVDESVTGGATVEQTATDAIYRAFVDVSVQTDALTYESTVAVAPGDPDGNETHAVAG